LLADKRRPRLAKILCSMLPMTAIAPIGLASSILRSGLRTEAAMDAQDLRDELACAAAGGRRLPARSDEELDFERRLAAKHQIDSEFVRVPTLAKIMAMSANSIYVQMRDNKFPLAHRRVGNVVLVKLADLARWYCTGEGSAVREPEPPRATPVEPAKEPPAASSAPAPEHYEAPRQIRKETRDQQQARIKREVLAEIAARRNAGARK